MVFLDYDEFRCMADIESAMAPGAPVMFDGWSGNLFIEESPEKAGRYLRGAGSSTAYIRRTYRNQRQAVFPWNATGSSAALDPTGRAPSSQLVVDTNPASVADIPRRGAEVAEKPVHVIAPEVGGGFGVKGHVLRLRRCLSPGWRSGTRRPIKWIEDQRDIS